MEDRHIHKMLQYPTKYEYVILLSLNDIEIIVMPHSIKPKCINFFRMLSSY